MTKFVVLALALAACGKGDSKATGGGDKQGGDLPADHVAAVNAAIPAEWKGKIEFEAGRIEESKKLAFKAAIPKGWKKGAVMPGKLEPADTDMGESKTLGKTELTVSKNCDGSCEKKDWAAVSDKVLYAQFTGGQVKGKVRKDEKRATGRTLVFEREPGPMPDHDVAIDVITTWWEADSPQYFYCYAQLGTQVKGLADAFEKACSQIIKE